MKHFKKNAKRLQLDEHVYIFKDNFFLRVVAIWCGANGDRIQ